MFYNDTMTSDRIEVHYLPSYSPELNPDEYLNGDLNDMFIQETLKR